MLNPDEKLFYDKQIKLFGEENQEQLKKSSIVIIGVGALGCSLAQLLCRSGVGTIVLIDDDVVEMSNLNRQILFDVVDVAKSKASCAAEKLSQQNPHIKIEAVVERITEQNAEALLANVNLVLDCSDNIITRYVINDTCNRLNKTWIYAALYENQGQMSVFNYQNGATYRCLFPHISKALNCAETGTTAAYASILASFQANEAIKVLLQQSDIQANKLLLIDLRKPEMASFHIHKSEEKRELITDNVELRMDEIKRLPNPVIFLNMIPEWEQKAVINQNFLKISVDKLLEDDFPLEKDKNYILICQKGYQSKAVAMALREKHGLNNVFSLFKGIKAFDA